jgi:DNA repair protein RadA/Sms
VDFCILSSNLDIAIEKKVCTAGEIGAFGELRPIHRIENEFWKTKNWVSEKDCSGVQSERTFTEKYPNENYSGEKWEEAFKAV